MLIESRLYIRNALEGEAEELSLENHYFPNSVIKQNLHSKVSAILM